MEIAAFTEPAGLYEICDVHDQRISFPVGHGISVVGRVRALAVCAAIGGDGAVRVTRYVFVEENHFSRQLNDPARRANSWNAGLSAIEHLVRLALVVEEVFYFFPELRFIGRSWS